MARVDPELWVLVHGGYTRVYHHGRILRRGRVAVQTTSNTRPQDLRDLRLRRSVDHGEVPPLQSARHAWFVRRKTVGCPGRGNSSYSPSGIVPTEPPLCELPDHLLGNASS